MASGAKRAVKLLVEGRPGSGKTTVAARLVELVQARGTTIAGFLTREIRERGGRVGFEVEALDGKRGTLAHVKFPGPPRVGRYGVDLELFERIAVPAIRDREGEVIMIDELGKMELASRRFRDEVRGLFDQPTPLVATVQSHRHPFTDDLKRRADVELIRVTRANRDRLPEELASRLDPA